MEKESGIQNEIIEGRNAVMEALRAGRAMDKLYISKGEVDRTLGHIASTARDKGIVVVECDRRKLDFMSRTHAHQGVIALAAVREYCSVEDLFAIAESRCIFVNKNLKKFSALCFSVNRREKIHLFWFSSANN